MQRKPTDVLSPMLRNSMSRIVVPRRIDEFLPMYAPNSRKKPSRIVCDGM